MKTPRKPTPETYIKDIRRKTRRIFTAEQKILIVMLALGTGTIIITLTKFNLVPVSKIRD